MKVIRVVKDLANPESKVRSGLAVSGSQQSCEYFMTEMAKWPEYHLIGRDMMLTTTARAVVVYRLVPNDFEIKES